jgi:hypothetical protein
MRRPEAMVKKGELTDEAWAQIAPLFADAVGGVTSRWRREIAIAHMDAAPT